MEVRKIVPTIPNRYNPVFARHAGLESIFFTHSNGSISSGIRPNWSAIKPTISSDHQQIRNILPWWQPCLKVELLELFGSI